jgi:afadin
MANSSELLHFLKQDREICTDTKPCQDHLAQAVQTAFHQLVDCMQADLHHVMPAFLDESMEDLQSEGIEHN